MCKVLCLLIASGNLLMMSLTVDQIMQHLHEEPEWAKFISPCLANMLLAVLLIIGVAIEEISLVKLFKMFFYAQLVFALLMVVFGYRLIDGGKRSAMLKVAFSIMFVVCAIELVIVSATLESMRKKAKQSEGLVLYTRTRHSV